MSVLTEQVLQQSEQAPVKAAANQVQAMARSGPPGFKIPETLQAGPSTTVLPPKPYADDFQIPKHTRASAMTLVKPDGIEVALLPFNQLSIEDAI